MFCFSRREMGTRSIAVAILAAGLWMSFAPPASGQIASYVDEHGKLVYINANTPARSALAKSRRQQRRSVLAAPPRLAKLASAAAKRNHVDPALVQAVIQTESGWNPGAVSDRGALGLMQLIPATAERFGVENVFDPAQNVEGGTRYLRELLDRFHGNLTESLAAYNAGEQAVERSGGVPNYPETRAYVKKVTKTYFQSGSAQIPAAERRRSSPIRQTVDRYGRVVFTNE